MPRRVRRSPLIPGSGLENRLGRLPGDPRVGMAVDELPAALFVAVDGGDPNGEPRLLLLPATLASTRSISTVYSNSSEATLEICSKSVARPDTSESRRRTLARPLPASNGGPVRLERFLTAHAKSLEDEPESISSSS